MSGRRANANRIRGPQSALTDFLAANNISAQQIRDTYEQRTRAAQEQNEAEASANATENGEAADAQDSTSTAPKKRKRISKKEMEKQKKLQAKKQQKKAADSEDDFDPDDSGADGLDGLGRDMYKKSKPNPGQLDHCEQCNKRFTVTPYTKTGPDGGLLCTPCGKKFATDQKKEARKAAPKAPPGKRRRQAESNRLDGLVSHGAKTLEQLCIEKVADHHLDIEEFGDLPDNVLERLSEIFSKKRVFTPRTLKLFLRPDLTYITINDAAYIESDDYKEMLSIAHRIQKLVLRNACQFKDVNLKYLAEKAKNISYLQIYAANLVTDAAWRAFFEEYGRKLEALKLQWLDASFDDEVVESMVKYCPNLRRLKLKYCRRTTTQSIVSLSQLSFLEHLSLQTTQPIENADLISLFNKLAPQLRTLSLEGFVDVDDSIIEEISTSCESLSKFRLTGMENITEAALCKLFSPSSAVPSLHFIDISGARDVDNNNPEGPEEEPIGLGANAFKALMDHSGVTLEHLDIASCRHVSHAAFCDVFNGSRTYPMLQDLNISFCGSVDTSVLRGIFACCPALRKVTAFGCFKIEDVAVPRGLALIGVPRAQDAIEQFGYADVKTIFELPNRNLPMSARL